MLESEGNKHKSKQLSPTQHDDPEESEKEEIKRKIRNTADIQRLKLEKLMKNPTKLVNIPEKRTQTKSITAPEFVRNVMGSSAGAGSGEFHVYRNLRRKELARQKTLAELVKRDQMDQEYETKKNERQLECEKKTAKKREKRKKKKEKMRMKKKAKREVELVGNEKLRKCSSGEDGTAAECQINTDDDDDEDDEHDDDDDNKEPNSCPSNDK